MQTVLHHWETLGKVQYFKVLYVKVLVRMAPSPNNTLRPTSLVKRKENLATPGGSTKGCDPGLEDARREDKRILAGDDEEDERQHHDTMDDQSHHNSHHIHAQLPGHHFQVLDGCDFATNQ